MLKRRITAKEKIRLTLASFAPDINVTEFCVQNKISRSALYSWQKIILDKLAKGL